MKATMALLRDNAVLAQQLRVRRLYYKTTPWEYHDPGDNEADMNDVGQEVFDPEDANLVSSINNQNPDYHYPLFDLDFPCALIPSTSEGHYHLYMGAILPWDDYVAVMEVLARVGLLQPGYVDRALRRGFAALRAPGVVKGAETQK